jgi:hypothetical protein
MPNVFIQSDLRVHFLRNTQQRLAEAPAVQKPPSNGLWSELEQSPTVVQKLHEDWERLGDRVIVGEEILGLLDRMSAAKLVDDEVVMAIWNNDPEKLRAYVETKLRERQQARRGHR